MAHEFEHSGGDPRADPNPPRPGDWRDPLSGEVHAWLNDFVKAAKAHRVYAENNEMLVRFVDRAHHGLQAILHKIPELSLSVREDRLLYGKDAVHINTNREDGLPFVLYRNAFRRITLVSGIEREEVSKLMRALVTDYSNFDYAGEDLVTTLWRYALPHLRYLTIDALSSSVVGNRSVEERADIDRIQGSIEDIVAAIYQTNAPDDDIVAGVSITKEDLEALKDIRQERPEDLDLLDRETSREIAGISKEELKSVQAFLASDTRDALVRRMMDVLVRILFKEQSARESATTIELLSQLFDSMVVGQRFLHATELIHRLRHYAEHSQNMQELHIARHLLRMFASESRVAPVLGALNEGYKSTPVAELVGFLRALGPAATPHLVGALDNLVAPAHRRLVCDLIVELGVPDVPVLLEKSANAKWFVVRDVLALAQHFPAGRIAGLILSALRHEHPKVRVQAVGMLRGYARGTADRLLVECFEDPDLEVRLTAYRVAAMRKSVEGRTSFERIFREEDLSTREPKELRAMTAAYAVIGGPDAVVALDALLNPGILASFKDPEPQIAAAMALGSIATDAAEAALQRGARTLNPRVREAVKRAQARHEGTDDVEQRRLQKAELTDLPTPEPEEPSGYTLHPALRNQAPSPTPLPNLNAADLSFSARVGSTQDPLTQAPDFRLPTEDLEQAQRLPDSPVLRPRPIMPHATRLEGAVETVPGRVLQVSTADLPASERTATLAVPPGISSANRIPPSASDLLRGAPTAGAFEMAPPPRPPLAGAPATPPSPPFTPPLVAPPRVPPPPSVSDLLRSSPEPRAPEVLIGRPLPAPTPEPPRIPSAARDPFIDGPAPLVEPPRRPPEVSPPPPGGWASDLLRGAPTVGAKEVLGGSRPADPSGSSDAFRRAPPVDPRGADPFSARTEVAPGPPLSDRLRGPAPVGSREVMPTRVPDLASSGLSDTLRGPPPVGSRESMPGRWPEAPPVDPRGSAPIISPPPSGPLPARVTGPVIPFSEEPTASEFDDESDEPFTQVTRPSVRAPSPPPPPEVEWSVPAAPIPPPVAPSVDSRPTPPRGAIASPPLPSADLLRAPPRAPPPAVPPTAPVFERAPPPLAPPRAPAPAASPPPAPRAAAPVAPPPPAAPPGQLAALEDDFAEYLRSFDEPSGGKK